MLDRFRSPFRASTDEMQTWADRKNALPSALESFRLMREIVAGTSSMIGTVMATMTALENRLGNLEKQQARIAMSQQIMTEALVANTSELQEVVKRMEGL
jgi:hypothetical protein